MLNTKVLSLLYRVKRSATEPLPHFRKYTHRNRCDGYFTRHMCMDICSRLSVCDCVMCIESRAQLLTQNCFKTKRMLVRVHCPSINLWAFAKRKWKYRNRNVTLNEYWIRRLLFAEMRLLVCYIKSKWRREEKTRRRKKRVDMDMINMRKRWTCRFCVLIAGYTILFITIIVIVAGLLVSRQRYI